MPKYFICILFSFAIVLFSCSQSFAQERDWYIHYLKQQAKNGSATEQYLLGRKYVQGNITDKNPSTGIDWLKKAAQNNYHPASLFLGEVYERGIGTEKNFPKAVHWYKKAAEQGSESASIKLAPILNKDPEKEFILYGLSLQKANKLSIRYALQDRGAEFLPQKSSKICDRFKTNNLLRGSDQMQVCYTPENKVAYLEYRFPSGSSQNNLQHIYEKFSNKYGDPANPEENSLQYVWQSKGVKINFWYNTKYNTAFLRYSLPQREKRFSRQIEQNNSTAE